MVFCIFQTQLMSSDSWDEFYHRILVTVPGPSQKWHQYLNKTFLSFSRPIDYLRPKVPATCIHGAAFIWDDLVWATTSLGDASHHEFTNISVFDKKGINAQCRRRLLCIGRHVLMSEQCSERILLGHHLATTWPPLGHHHIQEIQKTVTHHTWIWLQPSIPPT